MPTILPELTSPESIETTRIYSAMGRLEPGQALLARRREAVGEVHPRLRLALTLPWVGSTFPSWFPYFLASTNRSSYLVDWLIFHEEARLPPAGEVPPTPPPSPSTVPA